MAGTKPARCRVPSCTNAAHKTVTVQTTAGPVVHRFCKPHYWEFRADWRGLDGKAA